MLLFGPVPGGLELAVILLVTLVVLFGPVVLAVIGGLRLYNQRSSRLRELESEVEE